MAALPWSNLSGSHIPSASWQLQLWCCHPHPGFSLQQRNRTGILKKNPGLLLTAMLKATGEQLHCLVKLLTLYTLFSL